MVESLTSCWRWGYYLDMAWKVRLRQRSVQSKI